MDWGFVPSLDHTKENRTITQGLPQAAQARRSSASLVGPQFFCRLELLDRLHVVGHTGLLPWYEFQQIQARRRILDVVQILRL